MSAAPRPIPIVMGGPRDNDPVCVLLRVLERGQEDWHTYHVISFDWRNVLTPVLDHLIHEARLEVGVRHGIWICHVLPMDSTWTPMPPPPIAPQLRYREPRHWRTIHKDDLLSVTPDVLIDYGVEF